MTGTGRLESLPGLGEEMGGAILIEEAQLAEEGC